jgi:hypothetical protein
MTTPAPSIDSSGEAVPTARPRGTEEEGLRDWLVKSGFPLEMRVSQKWRESNWSAAQGTYFDDRKRTLHAK